jgi:hypothetical protein
LCSATMAGERSMVFFAMSVRAFLLGAMVVG